ncbi:cob(I)yrinic acid a,c-diamide adenosyltransferase [Anaerolineales bacterium HSG6]|nr:cob(I)yrinic acid a,c-diamide adenosyltransferase [Anaerolineales bacterium HSG6]MDM8531355.1 cob(I)yrinic acid a,c-diamide adenosyltransferase [Anaerolineales bacterium HSG25]
MKPYGRHLFICMHGNCAPSEEGEALQRQIHQLNREHGRNKLRNPERVKCTLADCLGVCQNGPIVAVYPEGIWYEHVDSEVLAQIYESHIINDEPVEAHVAHRLYPAGQEPSYAPQVRGDEGEYQPDVAPSSIPATKLAEKQADEIDTALVDGAAIRKQIRKTRKKKGLVIVNTGQGKGKTTAALGIMTRAWGRKMRIGVLQFLKNENARFGEIKAAHRMGAIDWLSTGDGWTWTSQDMAETTAKAQQAWQIAQERISSSQYDLFIMDEFTYPLHYGWLDTDTVLNWLRENKPPLMHLIITGRYAPPALIEFADLVTEMRAIKHPFQEQGIRAQAGIEY